GGAARPVLEAPEPFVAHEAPVPAESLRMPEPVEEEEPPIASTADVDLPPARVPPPAWAVTSADQDVDDERSSPASSPVSRYEPEGPRGGRDEPAATWRDVPDAPPATARPTLQSAADDPRTARPSGARSAADEDAAPLRLKPLDEPAPRSRVPSRAREAEEPGQLYEPPPPPGSLEGRLARFWAALDSVLTR